jgi:hypothetical protein
VVSIALVFWASFNLSAILYLIRFMGTRVSVLVPWISEGAFLAVTVWVDPPEGLGGGVEGVGGALGAAAAGC